jgi:hypothetical protein
MGFVSGFVDEIVSPLETAAWQIRQLSKAHSNADDNLQNQALDLAITFGGKGADAFFAMIDRQSQFIGGITSGLNDFATIFEDAAQIIKDAARMADWALGGPLLELAEAVLQKLSPHMIVEQGQSAITAITSDMRQNFHQLLDHSGNALSDLVHGHFSAALHDAGSVLGDLAHLGEDLFALLDQVETILGTWAGKVMEGANWLTNQFQSLLFSIEDFVFGFSNISNNAAMLADPNATGEEKAMAWTSIGITTVSDILLLIPGTEEGGVALDVGEKTVGDEIEIEVEQEIEQEIESELGGGGGPPDDGNPPAAPPSSIPEGDPPGNWQRVPQEENDPFSIPSSDTTPTIFENNGFEASLYPNGELGIPWIDRLSQLLSLPSLVDWLGTGVQKINAYVTDGFAAKYFATDELAQQTMQRLNALAAKMGFQGVLERSGGRIWIIFTRIGRSA